MFNLWGKIRLDGGEAKKDAEKAGKGIGQSIGSTVQAQFKGTLLRFLGAGAVIGVVKNIMQQAVQIQRDALKEGISVEAFQELSKGAERLGISVAELRKAAPDIPSFGRFMELIQSRGGIMDQKTIDAFNRLSDSLVTFTAAVAPYIARVLEDATNILGGAPGAYSGFGTAARGALSGNPMMMQAGYDTWLKGVDRIVHGDRFKTPQGGGSSSELVNVTRDVQNAINKQGENQTRELKGVREALSPSSGASGFW